MRCFSATNKILLCLLAGVALVMLSCKRDEMPKFEMAVAQEPEYIEPALDQFKEPTDLKIDYKKALYFNRASEALVFMGQEWAEKMSAAEDEEKLKMAASYEKAQDDLIRRFGIQGKEEFKWIQLKALHYAENKEVFARAGVWVNN